MDITSRSDTPEFRRYGSTQFRYAMTYVFITFFVLLFLNIYCSEASKGLFHQSKKSAMLEKCQLAADEISRLDVINSDGISRILGQMESLNVSRTIVTDPAGLVIYDSSSDSASEYLLLPEIISALQFNDAFTWEYQFRTGTMESRAATPIVSYGITIGCVYMVEIDPAQGRLLRSLQSNVLQITALLEFILVAFSLAFSRTFSRRLEKIMDSMKIIQEGDYSHQVSMGGNDELTALGDEFNDLTERLRTSEQKRRRFVSDASHELKTPLASIKLLTDSILQNDVDMDTVREFVGDIGNEAERLNRMTAKLLSLTKADGQLQEVSEIIYASPTIERVAKHLAVFAEQALITIQLELEEDTPILILEDDLYQIVYNLMENGIKYNIPDGTLTVALRREGDNALIQVTDTGMGIPEDAQAHVFERFYRVDKARSRASGGSGLGLAIVRGIVRRNRGDITLDSTLGKGTTFTVSFPAFDTEVDK